MAEGIYNGSDRLLVDSNGSGGYRTSMAIPDGADVAQGTKADAAVTNPALSASEIALLKGIVTLLAGTLPVTGSVEVANDAGNPLPVSAASLPLPTGAATQTTLASLLTELQAKADLAETQPVSLAALPALAAGSAAIGKLAANSGVDIGDVDVTSIAAGENHLGQVGGAMARIAAAELTRPADTTAYAVLDAISDSTSAPTLGSFANAARVNGGGGYIVGARLMTDQKTCVAAFRLHLFHTAPTAINDNAPQTLLYANVLNRVGVIDFPACGTEDPTNSTGAEARSPSLRIPFVCAGASRDLYYLLETLTIFTPASGQKFTLELMVDQN